MRQVWVTPPSFGLGMPIRSGTMRSQSRAARASVQRGAFLACLVAGGAAPPLAAAAAPPCAAFDHEHRAWTRLLEQYVKVWRVDYGGFHREAGPALSAYLDVLSAVSRTCYAGWTREQRLAFWIDTYNA